MYKITRKNRVSILSAILEITRRKRLTSVVVRLIQYKKRAQKEKKNKPQNTGVPRPCREMRYPLVRVRLNCGSVRGQDAAEQNTTLRCPALGKAARDRTLSFHWGRGGFVVVGA